LLLIAHQLRYAYHEAGQLHDVLKGVNLELARGERVALLGSSGSGKSTLLNLIGGIDVPLQGSIRIDGQDILDLREPALTLFRRRHIGFIYQQFNLIPTLSAAENILLPLALLNIARSEQQQRLGYWLEAMDLDGRETAFPDQLSGGEQQRVAIARALIHQPSLVLADEPTGNLDAYNGQQVLDQLFEVTRDQQQTLLLVTHSKVVADRADRRLMLADGMIQQGTANIAW